MSFLRIRLGPVSNNANLFSTYVDLVHLRELRGELACTTQLEWCMDDCFEDLRAVLTLWNRPSSHRRQQHDLEDPFIISCRQYFQYNTSPAFFAHIQRTDHQSGPRVYFDFHFPNRIVGVEFHIILETISLRNARRCRCLRLVGTLQTPLFPVSRLTP